MAYSNIRDIRMYYEIQGQGEPLFMVMGLGGHTLDWGWVLPEELSGHYELPCSIIAVLAGPISRRDPTA